MSRPSPSGTPASPAEADDPLARVVLAISAFRSDSEVVEHLEALFAAGDSPFAGILVVDSLSSGVIEEAIRKRRWPVRFWNSDVNLGAAGNHAKRMELASGYDADWCFALNADGELNLDTMRMLAACGNGGDRIGAVFPRRLRPKRGNSWEGPRKKFLPLTKVAAPEPTAGGAEEVLWGSSNGALYSLRPPRDGLYIWTDLWMAWEDLAYSWLLWSHGWKQVLCRDAVFVDPYEHRPVSLLGFTFYIHDKPSWISYYSIRNLALIVDRTGMGARGWLVVWWRWFQESLLALLYKRPKRRRLLNLWRGLRDGMRGRVGMVVLPEADP
jgi:GT2 family glycosyltransferase